MFEDLFLYPNSVLKGFRSGSIGNSVHHQRFREAVPIVSLIVSSSTAMAAIYYLAILDCKPPPPSPGQKQRRAYQRFIQHLGGVRVLILLAAGSSIIRTGIALQDQSQVSGHVESTGQYCFVVGAIIFSTTSFVHLKSQFFPEVYTPARKKLSLIRDVLFIGGCFILWIALTSEVQVARQMNQDVDNDEAHNDWYIMRPVEVVGLRSVGLQIIYPLLLGWLAVITVCITTSLVTKHVHASRAGISGPERFILAQTIWFVLAAAVITFILLVLAIVLEVNLLPAFARTNQTLLVTCWYLALLAEHIGLPIALGGALFTGNRLTYIRRGERTKRTGWQSVATGDAESTNGEEYEMLRWNQPTVPPQR